MAFNFDFTVTDNSDLVKNAAQEKILQAIEAVGIQAEGDVKISMNT